MRREAQPPNSLRIATRQSPLALWQAEHVKAQLHAAHPDLTITLIPLSTAGDRMLSQTLAGVGGKGLFVKELEDALLENRADLAVHSMKDVTVHVPPGLCLSAFLAAEDPRDALVSNRYATLVELPRGARVGTSSLRRKSQLLALRPDLVVEDLRGNVGTRLTRLDENKFDAVLLACAGLKRLGFASRIREALDVDRFVPAIGQGVIGIECRAADVATRKLLLPLNDAASATRLAAERALNAGLGGSCQAPVAGHAVLRESGIGNRESQKTLCLTGLVAVPDGSRIVKDQIEGRADAAAELGIRLADRLLAAGGREILRALADDA